MPKKEEAIEKENPKDLNKSSKTNVADQSVNRRSKRTAAATTMARMMGAKRVKTYSNILSQHDSNKNSEVNLETNESSTAPAAFGQLSSVASIDLTLDDD